MNPAQICLGSPTTYCHQLRKSATTEGPSIASRNRMCGEPPSLKDPPVF